MTATDLAADQAQTQAPGPAQDSAQAHDDPSCPTYRDPSRRRAVIGMAAAVGAFCAGCASSKSSSAATGNPPPASSSDSAAAGSPSPGGGTSSASDTSSAASSASAASSGSSGAAGSSTALAATADVPVGGGKINTDQLVVVTQPTAGTFKAFTAVCTHQGCTVATVTGGLIHCPCHGSSFHITDGSVAGGPAPSPLAPVAITVSGTQITKA